jgi:hypothetical protein
VLLSDEYLLVYSLPSLPDLMGWVQICKMCHEMVVVYEFKVSAWSIGVVVHLCPCFLCLRSTSMGNALLIKYVHKSLCLQVSGTNLPRMYIISTVTLGSYLCIMYFAGARVCVFGTLSDQGESTLVGAVGLAVPATAAPTHVPVPLTVMGVMAHGEGPGGDHWMEADQVRAKGAAAAAACGEALTCHHSLL